MRLVSMSVSVSARCDGVRCVCESSVYVGGMCWCVCVSESVTVSICLSISVSINLFVTE